MTKHNSEQLFLLEFLVDDINLEGRCSCLSPGELCVSFQFLDNEFLDVCEGDFNGDKKFGEDSNTKTGKSCLFSLSTTQAQKALQNFDITVKVLKSMQGGWQQSQKSCVGTAQVSIAHLFYELQTSPESPPPAKVLQDTYELIDPKGRPAGRVGVYIRLSCYGKIIITQFQMNMNDKSVLFKDKDGKSLYRYKKTKKSKTTRIEDYPCSKAGTDNQCIRPESCSQQTRPQQPGNYPQMQGGFSSNSPSMFPPPNANCPMQPCFPPPNTNCPTQPCFPDYGQSPMGEVRGMGPPSSSYGRPQQSARSSLRSSCGGGGCGRC